MSNPPSTTSPSRHPRRALLTGIAALTALAPVGIAGSTFGSSTPAAQVAHAESASEPVLFSGRTTGELVELPRHLVRSQVEGIQGMAKATIPAPLAPSELATLTGITIPVTEAPTTTTTVAPAPTTTVPTAPAAGYGDPADPATWDRLARCEAGGNWSINTGNGYYGGLQFSASSWRAVGGSGLPHQSTREEQILRGQILQARGGWSQWPACTRKLGYR